MNKNTILLLLQIFLVSITFAQTETVTEAVTDEKVENVDLGKIEKRNGKYGIVTTKNVARVPFQYDTLIEVFSDCIIASKKGKAGVIARDNKTRVAFSYDHIFPLKGTSKYLKTTRKGKCGVTTNDGKVVAEPAYEDVIWNDQAYYFMVKDQGRLGVLSINGEILLQPVTADNLPDRIMEDGVLKYFYFMIGERWGLVKANGTVNIPAVYSHLHYVTEHKVFLAQGTQGLNNYSILDGESKVIVPMQNIQYMVSPDFIIVKRNNQYGVIDASNRTVVPFGKYEEVISFNSKGCPPLAYMKANGKRGVMDAKGNVLTEVRYDRVSYSDQGCFLQTYINEGVGLFDQSGAPVLENKFLGFAVWTTTQRILATDEAGVRLYNFKGKQLSENVFEEIRNNGSDKYFSFLQNGKYGLINTEGEIVVKAEYDAIVEKRYFQNEIFGKKNGIKKFIIKE